MTAPDDLAQRLGAALGAGYAVERPLGEGGFAVVYLVRDLSLKRHLAVKVLSPELIASHAVLARFRREAETVAQLSHPNIVPVHFIGGQDELFYLAMPLIDGGSVADRLEKEGQLPVDDVVRIVREVASGLAHAHRRGVIHRDIKPANVLVDAESGRCLVTDFGIARSEDATSLTATGMTLGTPAYLSPEQVTGEPMDQRADIFALGVMAYEMLAGRQPYTGNTPTAAMMKRLAGPPERIDLVRPEVPKDVADVVMHCLATDPAERVPQCDDIVVALGGSVRTPTSGAGSRAMNEVTPAKKPAGAGRSRAPRMRAVIAVGTVLVTMLGAFVYRASLRPAAAAAPAAAAIDSSMVSIPAGDYPIGDDRGPALARPRHTVHVDAFAIDRTEVTVHAYRGYVRATQAPAPWGAAVPDSLLPVTRVPFGEATNYCAWKHGVRGRLPSEAEWEAAARGSDGQAYPWGDAAEPGRANTKSASRPGPATVGSFPRSATAGGVQDLSGNVWEWTSSPLAAYPGAPSLSDSMSKYRVIRGGAFDTADSLATGWMRGYFRLDAPAAKLPNTGFRCALPLP